jgi:hypothetical protein
MNKPAQLSLLPMSIAGNGALGNVKHASHSVPSDWTSLYQLSRIPIAGNDAIADYAHARNALPTDWRHVSNALPFVWNLANKYMAIARNEILANCSQVNNEALPTDVANLERLARIPAPELAQMIEMAAPGRRVFDALDGHVVEQPAVGSGGIPVDRGVTPLTAPRRNTLCWDPAALVMEPSMSAMPAIEQIIETLAAALDVDDLHVDCMTSPHATLFRVCGLRGDVSAMSHGALAQ